MSDGGVMDARVVVASTRAATGVYDDETGPIIREWLEGRGWAVAVEVVADGEPVGRALRAAVDSGAGLVVTTGGTGANPTDRTPEQTRPLLDLELPGVAEEIRRRGTSATPLSVLSRGVAGVAGRTIVVNLPGSRGGVRDGLGVLAEVLDHLVDQVHGGDHARGGGGADAGAGAGAGASAGAGAGGGAGASGGAGAPAAGSGRVALTRISETPITVEECSDAVATATAGAVVTFAGVVRDHDEGRGVTALSYTAHPDASSFLRAAAERVAATHPEVALAVTHRVGDLVVGDLALGAAVSSAHRAEAFAACAALVDDVKATVPIWKEQSFDDGSTEWVGALG
ncbi:molybdenum cofactor biosynthesis protein MoaE [Herbiconiux sp. A18JL235]|uniref:Molybdenum cofactor biosynthesis protein MoaE n=1 Tax=Herbiconiux sp. A18JL235 TaxID=3152363 RepID=A0AB39BKI3_9MICO